MPFKKELPEWNAPGIVPSEEAKKSGWGPNQHPPADWFNWQWNLTYQALKELQENAQHIDDSFSIADASLTQKGITQLNDRVDSDSTTQAATANAVKKVNDAVMTHSAENASLTQKGHVQLNSAVNSIDEKTAATPKAIKAAYDLANGKQDGLPVENRRKITFGTAEPTGGVDGDIYFQYE